MSESFFHSTHYLRHNARRLEHLASLGIPVNGLNVLEVGAGIGDHSHYYIDRGNTITITEARQDNLDYLCQRYPQAEYPQVDIAFLDMENPTPIKNSPYELIHCYGLLYHLKNPEQAIEFLAKNCTNLLFLETCVSFGQEQSINETPEFQTDPTQAFSGIGCRPTRPWVFQKLKQNFEYVYIPKTQPNHEEFPIDWSHPDAHGGLSRAIFIAARKELKNDLLVSELINKQFRQL
jgi:hypothetical protein